MNKYFEPYLAELFHQSDINEHLPILFTLGLQCQTIVEFGVRSGCSTKTFLASLQMQARRSCLYSYDINNCAQVLGQVGALGTDSNTLWTFVQADTAHLEMIPECDLLFIDTLHTHNQVVAEVEHHKSVRRFMVFHDTVLFGVNGEQGQPGIRIAIDTFRHRNPQWRILWEYRHNNGLLILERR